MGGVGFPVAPLLHGPAVVRVAFWCGGAVELLLSASWPPVRWCGPPGLANFDFRALFQGTLKDSFPSWEYLVRARFWGQGWSLLSPAAWLWAVCGCSPGPALSWAAVVSTTLVGKIVFSRRGLVCMDSVPVTINGDFGINLVDPASSHMLVSKIKPCMSQYKLLHGETANGSLKQLSFIW